MPWTDVCVERLILELTGNVAYVRLLMEEILHRLRLVVVVYHISHYLPDLYIPGGAGFLQSTVVLAILG